MSNFVILIGGPGRFKGCDKAHDQSWSNYIVPVQLAAQKNLYKKQAYEKVHWVLYEPPYEKRWNDDSAITTAEKKEDDGYNLHSIRKTAADNILKKGDKNYIARIKTIALNNGAVYKGIRTPAEFWSYLGGLADHSISRVWYSGHASGEGLMLSLTHTSSCAASAFKSDMVLIKDIKSNKHLAKKFSASAKVVSKFYGCYTIDFAESWHKEFGVSAAGAKNKIDFGVVNQYSNIVNVMERIEKTPTSLGLPDWQEFK